MSSRDVQTTAGKSAFWVFGYSSLCWKPGFTYSKCCIGYVKGYSRKFWQGSISHRGTEAKPGRVATLIEDDEAIVWGCAFLTTSDSSSAFRYLETRECSNGGYLPVTVTFYPADSGDNDDEPIRRAFPALTFIAYADNPFWLGDAPLPDISSDILECRGTAGHNVEYLLRLTDYIRENIPQEKDDDLFELELLVTKQIRDRNICLTALLNSSTEVEQEQTDQATIERRRHQPQQPQNSASKTDKVVTGEFTHRVPSKKLKCVNI